MARPGQRLPSGVTKAAILAYLISSETVAPAGRSISSIRDYLRNVKFKDVKIKGTRIDFESPGVLKHLESLQKVLITKRPLAAARKGRSIVYYFQEKFQRLAVFTIKSSGLWQANFEELAPMLEKFPEIFPDIDLLKMTPQSRRTILQHTWFTQPRPEKLEENPDVKRAKIEVDKRKGYSVVSYVVLLRDGSREMLKSTKKKAEVEINEPML